MGRDFSTSRIAVLGAGKMGGILVKALVDKHRVASTGCVPPSLTKTARMNFPTSWG